MLGPHLDSTLVEGVDLVSAQIEGSSLMFAKEQLGMAAASLLHVLAALHLDSRERVRLLDPGTILHHHPQNV